MIEILQWVQIALGAIALGLIPWAVIEAVRLGCASRKLLEEVKKLKDLRRQSAELC